MKNTALETTYFDFYGDKLIAVQDNATGEIYTSINAVLKGIGFKDRNQIRKRRDKWINDSVISKGITKFTLPTQKMVAKNDTTLFDEKDTYCISKNKHYTKNETNSTRISNKIRTISRQMRRCIGICIHR